VTMEDYEEGLGQEKASEEVENRLGAAAAILARKTPAPEIFEVFDREQETPAPAPVRRRWWQRLGCFNMNVQD